MNNHSNWKERIVIHDSKRNIAIASSEEEMITFAVEHFFDRAQAAIQNNGQFSVALSGGSTPKKIFKAITAKENLNRIAWEKVLLFWSDERAVPPESVDSNYRMAMESGFNTVPISSKHIFRMHAEKDIESNAKAYEETILKHLPNGAFDLVILGMGEDGHTASLFPNTHALEIHDKLVVANYVPEIHSWRMTLTFEAINQSRESVIYIMGKGKSSLIKKLFTEGSDNRNLPIDRVGTPEHPALWIIDNASASELTLA